MLDARPCRGGSCSVTALARDPVAGGATGAGGGNLLVSDKEPGGELELALLSDELWQQLADVLPSRIEYEPKGSLVVASDESGMRALLDFAAGQEPAGVHALAALDESPAPR
ncbi:FAD-dependent oxidoreductase [Streptomyces sp. NPDC085540]|uniref:FAD-dependent oxidoreductase n=1 Tax=Streptomyces sp. NPDC085540 TaxID=3365730 RepID=UPI0037D905F9